MREVATMEVVATHPWAVETTVWATLRLCSGRLQTANQGDGRGRLKQHHVSRWPARSILSASGTEPTGPAQ